MDLSLNLADMLQLGIVVVGTVLWLARGRTQTETAKAGHDAKFQSMGREIGELKTKITSMADSSELVIRLDERMKSLETTLKEQPMKTALMVGEAVKAALMYAEARRAG